MRYVLLLVMVLGAGGYLQAQVRIPIGKKKEELPKATTITRNKVGLLTMPELLSMQDWHGRRIDTTLKKKGYLLMQKEADSASTLFQYSSLSRSEDAPTTVRSLTFMDADVGDFKGRLISYRTYDKDEYREISAYLLTNNYRKTHEFDFDEEKHALYSNGRQEIRLKVITTVKDKRTYVAYELEFGK